MSKKLIVAITTLSIVAAGCSSGESEHPIKPLANRPAPTTDFSHFTAEQKIEYIQNSKAPDSEKQRAIEQVKAGKL